MDSHKYFIQQKSNERMDLIHRFFIFNKPLQYKEKKALGVLTEGETEQECVNMCQARLKEIVCEGEWHKTNPSEECSPEFIRNFKMEDKGYKYALVVSSIVR